MVEKFTSRDKNTLCPLKNREELINAHSVVPTTF